MAIPFAKRALEDHDAQKKIVEILAVAVSRYACLPIAGFRVELLRVI